MSHFKIAYDAIESYAQDKRPAADRNGKWATKAPDSDWGMAEGVWYAAASDIVNRFNAMLPGKPITVPATAKKNLIDRQLVDFQRYLAAKADSLAKTPLIKMVEA
jgi:hypothetical protein